MSHRRLATRARDPVIFDFDGVLANSFEPLLALNRAALGQFGRGLTAEGYRRLFLGNIHQALSRLLPDERETRRLALLKRGLFARYYAKVRLFPFAPDVINALGAGRRLAIVSSTRRPHILRLLSRHGLSSFFAAVFGSRAHSKKNELLAAAKVFGRAPARVWFVTDTVGDIKVGRSLGMKTVGVTWGFHGRARLSDAGCTVIAPGPGALLRHFSDVL